MRWKLRSLLAVFLLMLTIGCTTKTAVPLPTLMPTSPVIAAATRATADPALLISPTSTPLPTPLATATPPQTPTSTPTPTPTLTPTPTMTPTATLVAYYFPIRPVEVASYNQGHHDYPATDILAPVGTEFVAVTAGTVHFVSFVDTWDPAVNDPATRGGLSVAIEGFDGVRYYGSHLSAIAEGIDFGVMVLAGQTLGYIGNSGNARFTPSHLHFGISRITDPYDWEVRRGEVDPYPYLMAWTAGELSVPQLP